LQALEVEWKQAKLRRNSAAPLFITGKAQATVISHMVLFYKHVHLQIMLLAVRRSSEHGSSPHVLLQDPVQYDGAGQCVAS
jgi:hypothetical protein